MGRNVNFILVVLLIGSCFTGRAEKGQKEADPEEYEDVDDRGGGWLACDGTESEACHCEQSEIDCNNMYKRDFCQVYFCELKVGRTSAQIAQNINEVIFKDEKVLSTADLDINNKSFHVERATFCDNSITSLRKGRILPGHQSTIREIDFSRNKIVHIESGAFASFRALNKLHFSNNKLSQLKRDQFLGLSELHQLLLDNNKITTLGDGVFEHLTNLKRLVLDGNKIRFRKEMFDGLQTLEELSLDNCGITDLEVDAFHSIPFLKKLSLRGNPFAEVPRAVNTLSKLEHLDMSGTNIAEFHAQSLKDDHSVKQLYMTDMPFLYSIQDCAFCGLGRIERIYLNNCSHLHEIHPNAFGWSTLAEGKVTALTHFYVENGNLSTLSEDALPWDTLNELGIGGNPLNCTCETAYLLEDEYFSYEYTNSLPKCASPPNLKGHLLTKVAQSDACESKAAIERSNRFVAIFMVLLILLFCSIGIYLCYVTKRFHLLLQKIQRPQVSYSNLTNKDDQQVLECDFQPRPQEV